MTTENNLPKVSVPTTGASPTAVTSNELAKVAVNTTIPETKTYKGNFQHAIPMSTFYFSTGKVCQFRGGIFRTDDESQIRELREVCALNPMLVEISADGIPVRTNEDVQKEQAAKLL